MSRQYVVTDLDGTLIDLEVDWAQVRRDVGVRSIRELWSRNDRRAWSLVSAAELAAAQRSQLNAELAAALKSVDGVAILSNNSAAAIEETVRRIGGTATRWATIGREDLGSPKEHRPTFDAAVRRLMRRWNSSPDAAWYVGDARYEIDYARQLGLRTWHLTDWDSSQPPEGFPNP